MSTLKLRIYPHPERSVYETEIKVDGASPDQIDREFHTTWTFIMFDQKGTGEDAYQFLIKSGHDDSARLFASFYVKGQSKEQICPYDIPASSFLLARKWSTVDFDKPVEVFFRFCVIFARQVTNTKLEDNNCIARLSSKESIEVQMLTRSGDINLPVIKVWKNQSPSERKVPSSATILSQFLGNNPIETFFEPNKRPLLMICSGHASYSALSTVSVLEHFDNISQLCGHNWASLTDKMLFDALVKTPDDEFKETAVGLGDWLIGQDFPIFRAAFDYLVSIHDVFASSTQNRNETQRRCITDPIIFATSGLTGIPCYVDRDMWAGVPDKYPKEALGHGPADYVLSDRFVVGVGATKGSRKREREDDDAGDTIDDVLEEKNTTILEVAPGQVFAQAIDSTRDGAFSSTSSSQTIGKIIHDERWCSLSTGPCFFFFRIKRSNGNKFHLTFLNKSACPYFVGRNGSEGRASDANEGDSVDVKAFSQIVASFIICLFPSSSLVEIQQKLLAINQQKSSLH
jgi:hypothetical protein